MLESGLHILTLQECRTDQNGIFENQHLIRIVSAGQKGGILGTEVWLNKTAAFGHNYGEDKLTFSKNQLLVTHADPRLLAVKVKLPDKHLVIISGHCPHSLDEQAHRDAWWTSISDILKSLPSSDLVICGCDFNARLPATMPPHVGDLLCEKGNPNTPALQDLLCSCRMLLPATFSDMHNGPQDTWRHSTGKTARLDYIAVHLDVWDSLQSSAWAHLDAGNAIMDHSAVRLRLQLHWKSTLRRKPLRSIDWEQVRAPQNREKLCEIVAEIPVAPWSTMPSKQMQDLHNELTAALRKHFPQQLSRPKKPYISESTWQLRQKRKRTQVSLRLLRLLHVRAGLRDAWRVWTQAHCTPATIAEDALVPLATCFALRSLRGTAAELRARLRKDKAAFVSDISQRACAANGSEIFRALAPLRIGSRFSKRGIEPLPMWRKQDGNLAVDYEERLNVWRSQCSDLEAGHLTTPQDLLQRALDRARQRRSLLPPVQFEEFPSILQLEDRLRRIKRGKSAGNDGLRSDLFALAAPPLARHLFSLSAKLVTSLQEPLICKGGTLVAAYKGSGAADLVTNYRSLLLSSHMGKALRSHWRRETMPLYEAMSSPLHMSGKKGGNVSHASMALRCLLRGADQRNRSSAVIFLDISSAYYRVVREFVVNGSTSDEDLARILQRFHLPPAEFEALWHHLQDPDILTTVPANPRHRAIFDELPTSTWFTIPANTRVVETQAGSRPGDNLADIVFAFVYSRLLEHLRLALQEEGFRTFHQLALTDDLRSLQRQPVDVGDAPHLFVMLHGLMTLRSSCNTTMRKLSSHEQSSLLVCFSICVGVEAYSPTSRRQRRL